MRQTPLAFYFHSTSTPYTLFYQHFDARPPLLLILSPHSAKMEKMITVETVDQNKKWPSISYSSSSSPERLMLLTFWLRHSVKGEELPSTNMEAAYVWMKELPVPLLGKWALYFYYHDHWISYFEVQKRGVRRVQRL